MKNLLFCLMSFIFIDSYGINLSYVTSWSTRYNSVTNGYIYVYNNTKNAVTYEMQNKELNTKGNDFTLQPGSYCVLDTDTNGTQPYNTNFTLGDGYTYNGTKSGEMLTDMTNTDHYGDGAYLTGYNNIDLCSNESDDACAQNNDQKNHYFSVGLIYFGDISGSENGVLRSAFNLGTYWNFGYFVGPQTQVIYWSTFWNAQQDLIFFENDSGRTIPGNINLSSPIICSS